MWWTGRNTLANRYGASERHLPKEVLSCLVMVGIIFFFMESASCGRKGGVGRKKKRGLINDTLDVFTSGVHAPRL